MPKRNDRPVVRERPSKKRPQGHGPLVAALAIVSSATSALLLLFLRGPGALLLALRRDAVEVFLAQIRHVHPGVRHLVDRAIAVPDPLPRIRIVLVGRRVVVPRGDHDDSALWEDRR